jgi:flagellar FliL protein
MIQRLANFLLVSVILFNAPLRAQEATTGIGGNPIYVSMLPHFIVNLATEKPNRFLQLKAQVLVADKDTETALKLHMPAVRHEMIMMLSQLRPEDINSVEQKEQLIEKSLEVVRNTLEKYEAAANVEGFFVTNLVLQ